MCPTKIAENKERLNKKMFRSYHGSKRRKQKFITKLSAGLALVLTLYLLFLYRFEIAGKLFDRYDPDSASREYDKLIYASEVARKAQETQQTAGQTAQTDQAAEEIEKLLRFEPEDQQKIIDDYFGPLPAITNNKQPEHHKTRALYINYPNLLDQYLEMVKGTSINAFVIDAKESYGLTYASKLPMSQELGAEGPVDLAAVIEKCHSHNIRVIARIVCFKDLLIAENRPDLCISNEAGQAIAFPLEAENKFASPYKKEVWQYYIDIAKEVIAMGADEIQFDYVRFPSGGSADGSAAYFGPADQVPDRYQAINRFLQTAVIEIQYNLQTPLGADVFPIILTSQDDGYAIGQDWETIGLNLLDNIAPMIYPSHYANSHTGHYTGNGEGSVIGGKLFDKPDLYPYDVVLAALSDGDRFIDREEYSAIRPYLQGFTAEYLPEGYYIPYGDAEISDQIRALAESEVDEWIIWNASDTYPPDLGFAR